MPTTKKLNALKINKLTESQLAAATVNEDELYLVTDAENPVDIKTDATLTGNGSNASPLSVSPNVTAKTISASEGHIWFETPKGVSRWHMSTDLFEPIWVGEGKTNGRIGRSGATLSAIYAAKLCKDSTELSVRDGTSGDIAVTSELPEAKTGTAGQVYTKTADGAVWQDAAGGGSSADNNGLEGDYCSKYGIVDETASGLPTQGTGNQIIIPAQLVLDVPGVSGLTTNASKITHDLTSTTDCEIFLAEGTVIEATEVYWQTTEPEDGQTGYLAWWNGTEWKFKSNDTGNVWRAANAVRIAKCIFTDGSLTRLCFTGCRVLNKQEWLPKSGGVLTGPIIASEHAGAVYSGVDVLQLRADTDSVIGTPVSIKLSPSGGMQIHSGGVVQFAGHVVPTTNVLYDLGSVIAKWRYIYSTKLNNGADIEVPTTGGTMVVATPPATAGNYVLKATVAEDGTVTTQWIAETTQGIPDYTAGVSIPDATHSGTEYTTWYTATADGVIMGTLKRNAAGTSYLAVGEQELQEFGSSSGGDVFPVSITVNNGDVFSWKNNVGTGTTHNCVFFPFKS